MSFMSEIDIYIREAAAAGITLTVADFHTNTQRQLLIDGTPAAEWLDAVLLAKELTR